MHARPSRPWREEPMLGAVKDEGTEQVPLFRLLARRWKSLAPDKRERTTYLAKRVNDEQPKQARTWIEKPRQIYAHQKIERPTGKRGWNPWLWMK